MQLSCSKKNLFSKQCYFCVLVNSMGERGRKKYFVNYFLFKLVNFFTFVIYICLGWTRQWDIDWCFTWRRGHLQGSTSGEQCPLVRTDYLDITGRSTLLRRGGEDAWCSVNLTCCNLVFLKHKDGIHYTPKFFWVSQTYKDLIRFTYTTGTVSVYDALS